MFRSLPLRAALAFVLLLAASPALAQTSPLAPDIPKALVRPTAGDDYVKREVMIPMRDGVKLYTVIVIPKGARDAPIILTRTPYNAAKRAERNLGSDMLSTLSQGDEVLVEGGYIRVFQDVRGKFGSEGDYVMTRPPRGPLNASAVDHVTDAYDTIDWLVKNTPESNGRVGMIGSSYEGFTVLMALLDPHPALKAAVPMSPMVDGWKGDDWFHNGAFRQTNFDYIYRQTGQRGAGDAVPRTTHDDYGGLLRAGSAGDYAKANGFEQLAFWKKITEHPAWDGFWQGQALDLLLAKRPLSVPTMIVGSLWDQEDMYGAIHTYEALEPKDARNDMLSIVLGPWRHSGVNYDGSSLGELKFAGDTATAFRREVMRPFLDANLKTGAPKADTPPVLIYETGLNRWSRMERYPQACASGCAVASRPIYLAAKGGLSFTAPAKAETGFDEYVSDPAKPVPYQPRPVVFADGEAWRRWLVTDQRFVDGRPDVLTYVTAPLTEPLRISGMPVVNLFASTSGTDSDWVVKLIDVYPDEVPSHPEMGGFELGVGMDIFRGRYRESLEHPTAIPAGQTQAYRFALPPANHVFLPGHRIMVQVQSSWFPLYDRNPQTFVPNIFFAKPGDYQKATQRIYRGGAAASSIELPVVPGL
ncbi:CocE/NonD family hydrolase [Phenylobacterium aquaticum]|uniref:CocE/NonD family hydrolase n=1 Tax=Phenylobacterium aquaticum TaxID=1763816 RepID=UPI0026E9E821|nr:CocE/NonD family hydrolase [Phenylobacterium aquaticum]